jgi:hypothetical protein
MERLESIPVTRMRLIMVEPIVERRSSYLFAHLLVGDRHKGVVDRHDVRDRDNRVGAVHNAACRLEDDLAFFVEDCE